MDISTIHDQDLLKEIGRRFEEKQSSIEEMEFLTKKLLDLNEKNQKAQEVKSQFLSLVKNEFNNPISSLLSIASMLSKAKDLEKVQTMGALLKQDLLKIDFSLKNIFAASEIEAGEIANDYNHIHIAEIFEELLEYFSPIISDKELTVTLDNQSNKEFVSDSHKIYLILLNLLSNACEFSYIRKEVILRVTCDDKGIYFAVINFGEGVTQDHAKEIYNRFVHFETGHTRETAGLGLGLSVARGMAEALDGAIDNTHIDDATHFTVFIPYGDECEIKFAEAVGTNEFMFDTDDDGMVEF